MTVHKKLNYDTRPSKRLIPTQEEEISVSSQEQSKAPLNLNNLVPISRMKPNQVLALQRQFGNQYVLNMVRNEQSGQSHSIQRAPQSLLSSNKIQREPNDGGQDPEEFEVKGDEEHDKQATPDIDETQYVVSGDTVTFLPSFGNAIVIPMPVPVVGTGSATVDGRRVAVEGDEQSMTISGVQYIAAPYTVPGIGTLSIQQLMPDHYVDSSKSNGKRLIQKGSMFIAKFQVMTPAMQPTVQGVIPDSTTEYAGHGHFITTSNPHAAPERLDAK